MPFKPGNKLAGSRKGIPNKATQAAKDIARAANFCPVQALIDCHTIAVKRFIEEMEKEDSGRISPMESNAAKYLKIASDNASDVAGYIHPKLKSIEQTKSDPLEGMSATEKLEALRQAVKALEMQTKAPNGSGAS